MKDGQEESTGSSRLIRVEIRPIATSGTRVLSLGVDTDFHELLRYLGYAVFFDLLLTALFRSHCASTFAAVFPDRVRIISPLLDQQIEILSASNQTASNNPFSRLSVFHCRRCTSNLYRNYNRRACNYAR